MIDTFKSSVPLDISEAYELVRHLERGAKRAEEYAWKAESDTPKFLSMGAEIRALYWEAISLWYIAKGPAEKFMNKVRKVQDNGA